MAAFLIVSFDLFDGNTNVFNSLVICYFLYLGKIKYILEKKHDLSHSLQEQTPCYLGGKGIYAVENLCWGSAEAMVQSALCCQFGLNN